jgi:N-acylneuraminate cytidylyltransferase
LIALSGALNSEVFSEVMVSTEDIEIAEIAQRYGANIPFMRSLDLAKNEINTVEVLFDVIQKYEKQGQRFDYFACIYPTAPFITSERLKDAYNRLSKSTDAFGIMTVSKPYTHPFKTFKIEENEVSMMFPEYEFVHSQNLPNVYYDCAQFYLLNTEKFKKTGRIFSKGMLPLIIPENEVQDIDYPSDWHMAELKFKQLNRN